MVNDEEVLQRYLIRYKHRDHVIREVINLMQRYKGLKYNLEDFTFNDGHMKEDLLNLKGTISVKYKGSYYNIPVCIWLLDTYPQDAPMCYVKPTANMRIMVSRNVDQNGKVYLPYLHEWSYSVSNLLGLLMPFSYAPHSGSTLLELVQCMQTAFSAVPPMYVKPRDESRSHFPVNPFLPYPLSEFPRACSIEHHPLSITSSSTGSSTPSTSAASASISEEHITTPCSSGSPAPSTDIAEGSISEEYIKASLLCAIEQKLRRSLKDRLRLKRVQQELRDGQTTLEEVLSKLQTEITDFDKSVNSLQEKEKELQMAVDQLVDLL